MTQAMNIQAGHASGQDWGRAAKACLEQIGEVDSGANLGFVYVTDVLSDDLSSIVTFLRGATGIEHWVGTVGIGICAAGQEYFELPAVAVMIMALPAESFRVLPNIVQKIDEIGDDAETWIEKTQPIFGLVHGDPRNTRIAELIAELSEHASAYLVGGLSSSRGGMSQIAGQVDEGGLSGVLFSSDLPVAVGLTQGCSPIGPIRTVTQSHENVVITIEGVPALDVFKQDIGEVLSRDLARTADYIHVALPIPGSDTGDYLVRNVVGIDPEQGLVVIGSLIDPGDRIMFCRRDPEAAEQDLRRMLEEIHERLDGPVQGGIYVSCLARGPNMFGAESRELGIIAEELGDFPLVGFFANGEISHNRLYGYTGVLALFT
jgi:small ligand-binding sensory domain FIST